MKNFDWFKFVRDCEVHLLSRRKVSHLVFSDVKIQNQGPQVGAYSSNEETGTKRRYIEFFEAHGFIIDAIVDAINAGLTANNLLKEYPPKPIFHADPRILQAAFEKGKALQEELEEAETNPSIFFR